METTLKVLIIDIRALNRNTLYHVLLMIPYKDCRDYKWDDAAEDKECQDKNNPVQCIFFHDCYAFFK